MSARSTRRARTKDKTRAAFDSLLGNRFLPDIPPPGRDDALVAEELGLPYFGPVDLGRRPDLGLLAAGWLLAGMLEAGWRPGGEVGSTFRASQRAKKLVKEIVALNRKVLDIASNHEPAAYMWALCNRLSKRSLELHFLLGLAPELERLVSQPIKAARASAVSRRAELEERNRLARARYEQLIALGMRPWPAAKQV